MDRYLRRLGFASPPAPTPESLRRLHRAHLERIPFENLSVHLAEPIVLEPGALVAKIADRGRGGFCYELNGAFAALLRWLGYRVDLLAAGVFDAREPGPPFDHLCLRVLLDEPWLVDVGFGDNFLLPLRLDDREEQRDPVGVFQLVAAPQERLDLLRDGEPQYRFDLVGHELAEYDPMCVHHQTSPASHFTRGTVCSLATADGRVTIHGTTLVVTCDGVRSERELTDSELIAAYADHFGVHLDRLPG